MAQILGAPTAMWETQRRFLALALLGTLVRMSSYSSGKLPCDHPIFLLGKVPFSNGVSSVCGVGLEPTAHQHPERSCALDLVQAVPGRVLLSDLWEGIT